MTAIALALAGRIGSGKTSVSKLLSSLLGWPRVGFGDYVRMEAQRQGFDSQSREVLQELGQRLIEEDASAFCNKVLAQVKFSPGSNIIVDGIRHDLMLDIMSKLVRPSIVRLIYLDVSQVTRRQRLAETPNFDIKIMDVVDSHPTEANLTSLLENRANVVIDVNRQKTDVLITILESIQEFGVDQILVKKAIDKIDSS